MNIDATYLAVVLNSTLRMMTPILFVALGSALCNRVNVFNIGLEGMMLIGSFAAIVANHYTSNVWISLLTAMLLSGFMAWIAAVFMVKFKGAMLVIGISINTLAAGLTTFLMQLIFGGKGVYLGDNLVGLSKIGTEFLNSTPILKTIFNSLTWLDLLSFVMAILLYFVLFKTTTGLRIRSVGINKIAAESMGIRAERLQINTVVFSGILSGLGGCLLTMGGVVMFVQNITAGRGYIALAASTLGMSHPLGVVMSSALFGLSQSMANMLQNTNISGELTLAIPYVVTVLALIGYNCIHTKGKS